VSNALGRLHPVTAGAIFSTSFPSVENPISQGSSWLNGLADGLDWHDVKTVSTGAIGASDTFYLTSRVADDICQLKTSVHTFAAAQYAQGTIYKATSYTGNGGSHECELLLRFSIAANNAHGYECSIGQGTSGTYAFIVRWNGSIANYTVLKDPGGGTGSYVNAPTTMANGDVMYASIDANGLITLKQNGTTLLTCTHTEDVNAGGSTWASGQPGLGFWPVDGAIKENQGWSAYSAGEL
jgi:hypothetical protein